MLQTSPLPQNRRAAPRSSDVITSAFANAAPLEVHLAAEPVELLFGRAPAEARL